MAKYTKVKNGRMTKYGEAWTDGLCWGMFLSVVMFVLIVSTK